MLPLRRTQRIKAAFQDLDTLPYMNLMAILIPFLLSVTVFTRLAVLEIFLPPPSDEVEQNVPEPEKDSLILTVTIHTEGILVMNAGKIIAKILPTDKGPDLKKLAKTLEGLKIKYPDEESAIILSKPMIPYGMLVSVMDVVQTSNLTDTRGVLFPNISLGEVQ